MPATTAYKRLLLQGIAWDSTDAAIALYAGLKAASRAQLTEVKGGKVLIGTAGNGFNATFSLPNNGRDLSPTDAAEILSELLDRYAAASTALIARGIATPSDAQIITEMLALMKRVVSSYANFTTIPREVIA